MVFYHLQAVPPKKVTAPEVQSPGSGQVMSTPDAILLFMNKTYDQPEHFGRSRFEGATPDAA